MQKRIKKRILPLVLALMLAVSFISETQVFAAADFTTFGPEGFDKPYGVAVDSGENIYIADTHNHRIQKFDSEGDLLATWGSQGSTDGKFESPTGIVVDSGGNVYVVDTNNHRIQKFNSAGDYQAKWGSEGTNNGQFQSPYGIAVDNSGENIYVADTYNHRIQKFDSEGVFIAKWGSSGNGDGRFNFPNGIAVDSGGNVYVADAHNHRIQKFDSAGAYQAQWGGYGNGNGKFDQPNGMAVDSGGNVYVADTHNHRIQKFDPTGNFLAKWGSSGSGDGQFSNPYGIAVDSVGNIYVADTDNNRIQMLVGLTTIEVKTQPTKLTYTAGENLDLAGLVVTLTYNDDSTEDVAFADFAANGITADPANGAALSMAIHSGNPVTITHTASGETAQTNTLTVNPAPIGAAAVTMTAPAAGATPQTAAQAETATSNSGYTVSSAVWNEALTAGGKFKAGQVYTATITLTSKNEKTFQTAAFTPAVAGSSSVGTTTTTGAGIGNTVTFTVTFPATAAQSVTDIAVKTQPTKLTYTAGENLDLAGLVVTLTYNDDSTEDVAFADFAANGITADPANGTVMTVASHNGNPVTLTCNAHTATTGNLTVSTAPTYSIALSETGTHTFTAQTAGYDPVTPVAVTVTRTGTGNITNLAAALSGADAEDFTLEALDATTLDSTTTSAAFTMKPNDALTPGTYTATVTVTADNGVSQSFNIGFTVNAPGTVPGVPTGVIAAAGNGQAVVSFTPPADHGGSAITEYTVTSDPGNITATGAGTTITVTGLSNGTAYTFTVTASNAAGTGPASTASNAVTPRRPSNGGSDGSSTQPANTGVDILVNGKTETAATATTTREGAKTVTTVVVDDKKVEERLAQEGNNAVVTIPVNSGAEVVVGTLNGQTVKNMENKEAVLEIKTGQVTYTLPASQINMDAVSKQLGEQVDLKDIAVSVRISEPAEDTVKIVEDTANKNNYQIIVKPVEFEITCSSGDKTVAVSKFNVYVERMIAIPEGVDPSRITTGVILNSDGTFSHVPTVITMIDGKYYAKINSLTNSTYSVIYSPKTFKDVEKHWAKEDINDMVSRLVVSGVGDDKFEPDRDITRAEFAAVVVRALGIMRPETGKASFDDVSKADWYYDAISIAYEYGIISGYGNGKFGPMDKITREQAMTMIARAMKITGLKSGLAESDISTLLAGFGDSGQSAAWTKESVAACVKTGIVSGKNGKLLAPKDKITRAEVAVIVKRLLQKSNLL